MDNQINRQIEIDRKIYRNRQMDNWINRQIDRRTDTDIYLDRQIDRCRYRQMDRCRKKDRCRQINSFIYLDKIEFLKKIINSCEFEQYKIEKLFSKFTKNSSFCKYLICPPEEKVKQCV